MSSALVTTTGPTAKLSLDGGTLTALGTSAIVGDVFVYNLGTIEIGTPVMPSLLAITGSVTVGTSIPGGSSTGGSVTLNTGCTLGVSGSVMNGGVVNMLGSAVIDTLLAVSSGTINSVGIGAMAPPNAFLGSLVNSGTIQFSGALNILAIGGAYTQTSSGTLAMRLANGGINDVPRIPMAVG